MSKKPRDIRQKASSMSGKERARLILKDLHEKTFVSKKGFLTAGERKTLLAASNKKTGNDFEQFENAYSQVPFLIGWLVQSYLYVKLNIERLENSLFLERIATSLDNIREKIEEPIALKTYVKLLSNSLKSEQTNFKKIIDQAHSQACRFLAIAKVIEGLSEELGFDVLEGILLKSVYERYMKDIKNWIDNYNKKAKKILKDYTIPNLKYDQGIYKKWRSDLLKKKSPSI
jgi:hypothetical protein